ncbi:MAG: pyrroloquinoline quinone biosynthesis peptide chaperone PqqD [Terrimicrobiaceae bacterium]|nr:pyrroloquinoline quinone biosynthesis peptide chaperone PqqD [Terrimicrobiaceae bacterium]
MPADSQRPRLAPHVRRQLDRLTRAPMLLHPEGAVELSETADAIVRLCNGNRTIDEIAAALAAEYEAEPGELRGEVTEFLAVLAERGLLAEDGA